MFLNRASKRWIKAVAFVTSVALLAGTDVRAQSTRHRAPVFTAPTGEDDRDPAVFQRNLRGVTDRAMTIGTGLGFSADALAQIEDARRRIDTASAAEMAAAAEQLGPEVARANRALARIVIVPAPRDPGANPVPLSGASWQYDPANLVSAPYPSLSVTIDQTVSDSRQNNTNGRVCSNAPSQGCSVDDDCPGGTCVERSTTSSGGAPLAIGAGCTQRPSDANIQILLITATILEGIQMVADRICGQEFFGFNISLVCIITDLLFLIGRSLYDFETLCADRWSDAENQAAYDRLGHLHGDVDTLQLGVTNGFSSTSQTLVNLNSSVNTHFFDTNTSINTQFFDTNNSIDTHFTQTQAFLDQKITDARTLIQNQLTAQANAQRDLFLQAELERVLLHRERLAIYYLPEAQGGQLGRIRTLVEQTILRVQQSGETTGIAQQSLQFALADVAGRRYKRAFNYFSAAYFEAIKYLGETQ